MRSLLTILLGATGMVAEARFETWKALCPHVLFKAAPRPTPVAPYSIDYALPKIEGYDVEMRWEPARGRWKYVLRSQESFGSDGGYSHSIVRWLPKVANILGLKILPVSVGEMIEYFEVAGINDSIESLSRAKKPYAPAVRFYLDSTYGQAPHLSIARHYALGEVIVAANAPTPPHKFLFSNFHNHDLFTHGPGYLMFPQELVDISKAYMQLLLDLHDHPSLQSNDFHGAVENEIKRFVEELDEASGLLSVHVQDLALSWGASWDSLRMNWRRNLWSRTVLWRKILQSLSRLNVTSEVLPGALRAQLDSLPSNSQQIVQDLLRQGSRRAGLDPKTLRRLGRQLVKKWIGVRVWVWVWQALSPSERGS